MKCAGKKRRWRLTRLVLALAAISPAGCDTWNQYRRFPAGGDAAIWRPTGVPNDDLNAMVAHPADLLAGRGTSTSDGDTGARAVDRLRHDRVTPLPVSSISNIGTNGPARAAPAVGGN
jgi:hypothetical protein